jgi:hypothetical protein
MAMKLDENSGINGKIEIWRIYPTGRKEFRKEVKNIVTNAGLYRLLDLSAASGGVINYYAWGSSGVQAGVVVPKVASTSGLVIQDGARPLDGYSRTSNSILFTATLPTTVGNTPGYINEFMIASSGAVPGDTLICIAAQAFENENKDSTFELQFIHSITISNV